MSLRPLVPLAAVLGLVAVGVWVARGKPWERYTQPAPVAVDSTIKPRSAAEIIARPSARPRRPALTIQEMLAGKTPTLEVAEMEAFLRDAGRTTVNLLAVSRLLKDLDYAREAARAEPLNPLTQLELALRGETPEEKAAALAAFRRADPDNSLGDYLAAHQAFQSADTGGAGAALLQALEAPLFTDYLEQSIDGSEQAFLHAGYDPPAAALAAWNTLTIPSLPPLLGIADQLESLQREFIRSADFDAAEPTVIIGLTLGRHLQEQGAFLLDHMVGMSIERRFLQQLDPLTAAGPGGQTAAERLDRLQTNRIEIQEIGNLVGATIGTVDQATQAEYLARVRADGELAAGRWYRDR